MLKNKLYAIMQLSKEDIAKGEARYSAFDKASLAEFLNDDMFSEVNDTGIQADFPADLKALIINCIAHGTQAARKKIARKLLYEKLERSNKLESEGLFDLAWCWISNTQNKEVRGILSEVMLLYVHDERAWQLCHDFILDSYPEVVQSIFYKPVALWSLFKNKDRYREMWSYQKANFPEQVEKIYRSWGDAIEQRLDYQVARNCLSLHRIENPWKYTDSVIHELRAQGVDIALVGDAGGIVYSGNGELLYSDLYLNGRLLGKAVGGPFVANPQRELLFCHILDECHGLALSVINLKTNQYFRLDSSSIKLVPHFCDDQQLTAWLYDGTTVIKERNRFTFYVPEQLWEKQDKLYDLEKRSGWSFSFDTHYLKSMTRRVGYMLPEYGYHFQIGRYNLARLSFVLIAISAQTGEIDGFYYDEEKQQLFLMKMNASLGELMHALKIFQGFMHEEGFSAESYFSDIPQLSEVQMDELKRRLVNSRLYDSNQHQFWRWFFEPARLQPASIPKP